MHMCSLQGTVVEIYYKQVTKCEVSDFHSSEDDDLLLGSGAM
jgi:hypothetical protein